MFVRSRQCNQASRGQGNNASSPLAPVTVTHGSSVGKCYDAWSCERRFGGLSTEQIESTTALLGIAPPSGRHSGSLADFKRHTGSAARETPSAKEKHRSHGLKYASGDHRSTRLIHFLMERPDLAEPTTGATASRISPIVGPGISSFVRSTSSSGPGSPMQRSVAQLIEDHEWDSRSYMSAASRVHSPDEKCYRIEMAIAAWTKAFDLARSVEDANVPRLVSLLLGRGAAYLQLAALSFGTPRSKASFEFACMDASAVIALDTSNPQALLLRARASIALACSDFTKDAAVRDLRLKDATRDLNAVRAQGTAAENLMVHTAITWENAARMIAERFTAALRLPFPCITTDVTLLAIRLECDASPHAVADGRTESERERGMRSGAPAKQGFVWHSCDYARVLLWLCGLGGILMSLIVHMLAVDELVRF